MDNNMLEIKFDELSTYDFTKVQDRLREITLEINPLVFALDNAQFLIEGRVMNLSEGFPPKLEIGFIYNWKGELWAISNERKSTNQEVVENMFKVDLYVVVEKIMECLCESIRYKLMNGDK